jgi:CDP-diacylglycerol--serine O-phosphatidyltransferase
MQLVGEHREMRKVRYIIPNMFTAISLLMGIASIVNSMENQFELASWFILWCVLLDKADGTAARMLNASSPFGSEFDSMADLVAFGLAPAFLVYAIGRNVWQVSMVGLSWFLMVAALAVYVISASGRLARYNIIKHEPNERYFQGIPSTLCGAIISSSILVSLSYTIPNNIMAYYPVVMALLGIGMVSVLPVPKVVPRKSKAFNLFQLANVVAVYVCGICKVFPEYFLGLGLFYLIIGSLHGLMTTGSRADILKERKTEG